MTWERSHRDGTVDKYIVDVSAYALSQVNDIAI